jgi:hypothetical protein
MLKYKYKIKLKLLLGYMVQLFTTRHQAEEFKDKDNTSL